MPNLRDQRRRLALPHFPYVDAALPQPRYGAITLLVNLLTHSPVDHLPSQPLAHLLHGRKLLHHLPVPAGPHRGRQGRNAISDICCRSLDIERPTYTNLSSLGAQVISCLLYTSPSPRD